MEKRYKIIAVDNYDRETISDTLIADNVHELFGKEIVDKLNDKNPNGSWFFRLVPLSHKLFIYEP